MPRPELQHCESNAMDFRDARNSVLHTASLMLATTCVKYCQAAGTRLHRNRDPDFKEPSAELRT